MKVTSLKLTKRTELISYIILSIEILIIIIAITGIKTFIGIIGILLAYASVILYVITYYTLFIGYHHVMTIILVFIVAYWVLSHIRIVKKEDSNERR